MDARREGRKRKLSLNSGGKRSPSEAVVSYCLSYCYSSGLVKPSTQASQRGAIRWHGGDTEGLGHSSQLWAVSWLEHATGSHKFSTWYYHFFFLSSGKDIRGHTFAQLLLFSPRAVPLLET